MAPQKPIHAPRPWTERWKPVVSFDAMSWHVRLDARTQFGVPSVRLGVLLVMLDCRRISWLEILQSSGLDPDQTAFMTNRVLGLVRGSLARASAVGRHIEISAMKKTSDLCELEAGGCSRDRRCQGMEGLNTTSTELPPRFSGPSPQWAPSLGPRVCSQSDPPQSEAFHANDADDLAGSCQALRWRSSGTASHIHIE